MRESLGIKLSRETTYLTEPLDERGYVNYVAALNKKCAEGVTPENNAVVALLQAAGPRPIPEGWRAAYFKALGIRPLPQQSSPGDTDGYYQHYVAWQKARSGADLPSIGYGPPGMPNKRSEVSLESLLKELDETQAAPWTTESHPDVARWLNDVQIPLDRVVQASKRSRYYEPILGSDRGPDNFGDKALLAEVLREFARTLARRSMLHLGEGRIEMCQRDLLALHRLARLHDTFPSPITSFVAYAIDGLAREGDLALAQSGRMSALEAADHLATLKHLSPFTPLVDKFDVGERFELLDAIADLASEFTTESEPVESRIDKSLELVFRRTRGVQCDWNLVLRAANAWNDRVVAAFDSPTFVERQAALESVEAALGERRDAILARDSVPRSKSACSREVADLLLAFIRGGYETSAHEAEVQNLMRVELTQLAVALAGYHAEHGEFPELLAALQPKYFDEIPLDRFSGQPLKYSRQDGGYLLYSVGPNLQDEGGVRWPRTAEVVVRFEPPLPEPLGAP